MINYNLCVCLIEFVYLQCAKYSEQSGDESHYGRLETAGQVPQKLDV